MKLSIVAVSVPCLLAVHVTAERELFSWKDWFFQQDVEPDDRTATEKIWATWSAVNGDYEGSMKEQLPFIERIFEQEVAVNDMFRADEHTGSLAESYVALNASLTTDEFQASYDPLITADGFNLKAYMAKKLPVIRDALEASVSKDKAPINSEKLVESALYTLMAGGKRLRPLLCLATFEMFDTDNSKVLPTAASSELIHAMSLISDDMPYMDNDSVRRGVPTNHVVYGEDVAMLAAGSLVSFAFTHILEETKNVPAAKLLDVVGRLAKVMGPEGLAGGEAMDLALSGKDDATLLELEWIHLHKTASLMQYAVTSGAILGGAKPSEILALDEYAKNLGLAFQVVDDILDVTQTTEELGKTAGKDEAVDKLTYPKLLGLDGATKEAQRLVRAAKSAINAFGDRAIPLVAIADFVLERTN